MQTQKYTDSDKYQREIAEQYKKRVAKFSIDDVVRALNSLHIAVDPKSIQAASVGNVNATYLTPELVVKINQNKEECDYLSNKLVSDKLSSKCPVVKVVAYDFFEKTNYEVLVMERAPGTLLLDDIFDLDTATRESLFRQVLGVVKQMFMIEFTDFGEVNSNKSFSTYTEFLKYQFAKNVRTIREQKLGEEADIVKVERYFLENVVVFNNERSVFVHTDLHMGNILHQGNQLTAVLDFDHSLKAPKARILLSLLGFVDNPSQFVEGTKDFAKYKDKNFYSLLPILKEELSDIFADSKLLKKLNVQGIKEGVKWIADNWSADWNKEMISNLVNNELAGTSETLHKSYFGKVLNHLTA